mgnify:CR=1 FL=1
MPNSIDSSSLSARDAQAVVHGLTNLAVHAQRGASVIESGHGVWVRDVQGREYIEAMSGLWCIALGYGNERLADVAQRQMKQLAYYPLTHHKSHPPVIALAEKLLSIAPAPMSRIWFASTGSEANDCAARLSWYYWNALGQPQRRQFISHKLAYHGNTIASASLSGVKYAHERFNLPLPGFHHVTTPHHARHAQPGESEEAFSDRLIADIERLIEAQGAHTIAAFFVEPVMGAGGIVVPPARYYERLQALLKQHDILLVCDEVVTAFGRTGEMFGSTTMKLQPDLLVCAKALSSAYIPISALMIGPRVYEAIERQSGELGMFGLTMTYSGHPVACAAAIATLDLMKDENLFARAGQKGRVLGDAMHSALKGLPNVISIRTLGLAGAVELASIAGSPGKRAYDIFMDCFHKGVWVRPAGENIVICPPYIVEDAHIDQIVQTVADSIRRHA